jgi:membrane protein implicated in regulation of membrane protease activity
MTWWVWCIFGTALLALELLAIDAQFYFVFLGLAAIVVGLLGLIGIDLPEWAQWMVFAVLAIATMLTIRRQLYEKLRRRVTSTVDTDVAQLVQIPQELAPGKSARIQYRGTDWTVHNVGDRLIPAGQEVRIEAVDGLTLRVRFN